MRMKGSRTTADGINTRYAAHPDRAPSEMFRSNDDGWQRTITILKDSGAIGERKPVSAYRTNAFVSAP